MSLRVKSGAIAKSTGRCPKVGLGNGFEAQVHCRLAVPLIGLEYPLDIISAEDVLWKYPQQPWICY